MPFLEDCIERSTAIAAACGWIALGGGIEAAVGVVVGAAGLASAVTSVARRHGPESQAALNAIRKRIAGDMMRYSQAERWDNSQEIQAADAALGRALAGCFLDRRALAESARAPGGFPKNATRIVLNALSVREPAAFGDNAPPVSRRYAEVVVTTALEAAIENEAYFKELEPHLLLEMLKGIGVLEVKIDAIHDDVRETLATIRRLQPQGHPNDTNAVGQLLSKQNLLLMRQIRSEISSEVLNRNRSLTDAIVMFAEKNKLVHYPAELHDAPWDALVHIASRVCDFQVVDQTPDLTLMEYIEGASLGEDVTYNTYLEIQSITFPASDLWRYVKEAWALATTVELGADQLKWEQSHGVSWLWEQFGAYRALEEKLKAGIASGSVPSTPLRRGIVNALQSPSEKLRSYMAAIDDKPWNYAAWWPKGATQTE